MPFKVNFRFYEPNKQAPYYQTTDRKLAYVEIGHIRQSGTLNRVVPEVTYIEGNSQDEYVWLVYRVLKAIRKYYDERNSVPKEQSNETLKVALALEKQLDLKNASTRFYIQQHPKMTPDNPAAFAFFEVVEAWRKRWKEYFSYKKQADKDPKWEKKLKDDCFAMEKEIKKYVRYIIGL